MNFIKKIVFIGGSGGIVIPKSLMDYYNLNIGSEVIISDDEDKIIIQKK